MRVRLTVRHNLDEMFAQLDANLVSRVPIAVAIAINKTIREVADAERAEMLAVFDRPTPWTLNSFDIEGANASKLEAAVSIRSQQSRTSNDTAEYMEVQIDGGIRQDKRHEFILRKAGYLPAGMNTVPGRAAEYDAYGNIKPGLMRQILSGLRVSEQGSGSTSNRPIAGTSSIGSSAARKARARKRQGDFFVALPDRPHTRHLAPGIYRRFAGKRIQPVLMFVRRPSYRGILQFDRVAQDTADAVFPDHLREQLAISVRKAA